MLVVGGRDWTRQIRTRRARQRRHVTCMLCHIVYPRRATLLVCRSFSTRNLHTSKKMEDVSLDNLPLHSCLQFSPFEYPIFQKSIIQTTNNSIGTPISLNCRFVPLQGSSHDFLASYFAVGCWAADLCARRSTIGASAAFAAGISNLLLASFFIDLVSPLKPR